MSKCNSISQLMVLELFTYHDGQLFWNAKRKGRKRSQAGYQSKAGYTQIRIDGKLFYLHRLVWIYHNGDAINEIDHIDGNPTNNKIENLRNVAHNVNLMNAKFRSNNTSGYRGVTKSRGKWAASIQVDKKKINLGVFATPELASEAYKRAALEHYGNFVKLNPTPQPSDCHLHQQLI